MALNSRVMSLDSEDMEQMEDINREAFPDEERIELAELLRGCNLIDGEILGWYEGENLIGFSVIERNEACAYLNYFAIKHTERCKGYGHQILQMIQNRYSDIQLILDFEILDPRADNYEIRKRRKAFYLRNGMYETGYYTKLDGNYLELVCNCKKINVDAAADLLRKIHKVMPKLSEKLYDFRNDN